MNPATRALTVGYILRHESKGAAVLLPPRTDFNFPDLLL